MADTTRTLDEERAEIISQLEGAKKTKESPTEVREGSEPKSGDGQPTQKEETTDSQQATEPEISEGEGEGDVDETKLESRYEKLKKAEARQAKTWQKLDSEREAVKAERAALDQQRAEIERLREETQRTLASDAIGRSPEMYRRAAEGFRAEGEEDLAEQAEKMAKELEQQKSEASKQVQVSDLKRQWDESVHKAVEANPELKDSTSPLFKEVTTLLRNKPVLGTYPDGFNDALEVSKAVLAARKASELEKQNSELSKELERYKSLTSLGDGGGSRPGTKKKFEDLSLEDQRAYLLKAARG